MARARHPLYSEHPLDEVIHVTLGGADFGKVGRYKGAKTWFAATPNPNSQTAETNWRSTYRWSDRRFDSESGAKTFLVNQWSAPIRARVEAEVKRDFARQFEALQRARADVMAKRAELDRGLGDITIEALVERCSADDLAQAIVEQFANCYRHGVRDEVVETLRPLLAEIYTGEVEDEIAAKEYDRGHESGYESGVEDGREQATSDSGHLLRALGAAAYGAITEHDRSVLRDYLAREHNAYNKGGALLL